MRKKRIEREGEGDGEKEENKERGRKMINKYDCMKDRNYQCIEKIYIYITT